MNPWPYLAWMRPQALVATFFLVFTGWAASPQRPTTFWAIVADLAWLQLVHGLLLWGGSNALNGAEDDDDGPVNLLPDPPPKPRFLGELGLALLALGVLVGLTRGATTGGLCLISALLSVFYSKKGLPWPRGKDIPGVDNLINAAGTGIGAIGLGWTATGAEISAAGLYVGLAFSVATFGGIPTSQIFQLDRSEHNWTQLLGPAVVLRLGALLFALHLAMLASWGPWSGLPALGTAIWALLTAGAAIHSFWWSFSPMTQPYARMTRQMGAMITGQFAWSLAQC